MIDTIYSIHTTTYYFIQEGKGARTHSSLALQKTRLQTCLPSKQYCMLATLPRARRAARLSAGLRTWLDAGLSFRCTACGRCCQGGAERTVQVRAYSTSHAGDCIVFISNAECASGCR